MDLDLNTLSLLGIAIFNAITGFLAWRIHLMTVITKRNVEVIEVATNSMKDALVAATGKAERAAGAEEERMRGEAKAAALAEGKLSQ
jgi:hypothetical protein